MLLPVFSSLIALLLPPVIMLAAFLLSTRSVKDREKLSPFECGFDPKNKARIPFSTRFFLLAVIFLVFDIEIVLLMPAPASLNALMQNQALINIFLFLVILMAGLLHEWNEGSLSWAD
uniref:NADH dehydrogenase subunit 3 n=1 Tax=Rhynchospio aff. asiatica ZW-2021 TaxID=2813871 RepID=UPI0023AAD62C|nr:NADH dehydrogenase subunit 3 [Rhynchospio aff. asiatica ZW-2021]WCI21133.1 NADH dehydrogenase subunit 3 [Rhynchospio aff. asiatica ZW-2021]